MVGGIYKHDRGVELGSTKKQLRLNLVPRGGKMRDSGNEVDSSKSDALTTRPLCCCL